MAQVMAMAQVPETQISQKEELVPVTEAEAEVLVSEMAEYSILEAELELALACECGLKF